MSVETFWNRETDFFFSKQRCLRVIKPSRSLWLSPPCSGFFPLKSCSLFLSATDPLAFVSASQSRCLISLSLTSATLCSASSTQSQLEFLLTSPWRTTIGEIAESSSQSANRMVKSSRMLPPAGWCGRGLAYSLNPTAWVIVECFEASGRWRPLV